MKPSGINGVVDSRTSQWAELTHEMTGKVRARLGGAWEAVNTQ